jgi:hypothetical protein
MFSRTIPESLVPCVDWLPKFKGAVKMSSSILVLLLGDEDVVNDIGFMLFPEPVE